MKYLVFVLPLLLAGCASRSGTTAEHARSQKAETPAGEPCITSSISDADAHLVWKKVENLTGEPLVDALISYGDIDLAELKERRRNVRLEIAALALEKISDQQKDQLIWTLTAKLHTEALERKMALWKAVQKK
ncbi:MAG TPA: hypothetical protein VK985_05355 [Rariglobus sp.]|nr:hypothetical protein [Rariglobus sp.]